MKLYHLTSRSRKILTEGFRDRTDLYGTLQEWTGVWLSDVPLGAIDGIRGDTLLMLDIPEEIISQYEWIGDGKSYREFLVPADLVNKYGPPTIAPDD